MTGEEGSHPREEKQDGRRLLLPLLLVLAANLRFFEGVGAVLDPSLAMDPYYLGLASLPASGILLHDPAWGPLYALWLRPFLLALGDPLTACLANLPALSIGTSGLLCVFLMGRTGRSDIAVGGALLWLLGSSNVPLNSRVGGFAWMVILAGLVAADRLASRPGPRRAMVGTGVLLAAYARPELYPAALVLVLSGLWLAVRRADTPFRQLPVPIAALAVAGGLALGIGAPIAPGSGRLEMAFREHFAWNWHTWHPERRGIDALWSEVFGNAASLPEAAAQNPAAFLHHLAANASGTLQSLLGETFRHLPVLAPATLPRLVALENLLLTAMLFGILLGVLLQAPRRQRFLAAHGDLGFVFAILGGTSLLAGVTIYPLAHYLLPATGALFLLTALALPVAVPLPRPVSGSAALLLGLGTLLLVPRPFLLPPAALAGPVPGLTVPVVARPVTDTVRFLRSLDVPRPTVVLTVQDGLGALLGEGFDEVRLWQKGATPLADYLRSERIDLVVNFDRGRDTFGIDDPAWPEFQTFPERQGFTRLPVPGHEAVRVYRRIEQSGTP